MNQYIVNEIFELCPDKIVDRVFIQHIGIAHMYPSLCQIFSNNPTRMNFITYMNVDTFNAKTLDEQFERFTNVLIRIASDGNFETMKLALEYFTDINRMFHVTFRICEAAIVNRQMMCYMYLLDKLIEYFSHNECERITYAKRDEFNREMELLCKFIYDTENYECIDIIFGRYRTFCYDIVHKSENHVNTIKDIIDRMVDYFTYHGKYKLRKYTLERCDGCFEGWYAHHMRTNHVFTIGAECLEQMYDKDIRNKVTYCSLYFENLKEYYKTKRSRTKDDEYIVKIIKCIRFILTMRDYKPNREEMKLFHHFNRVVKAKYHK